MPLFVSRDARARLVREAELFAGAGRVQLTDPVRARRLAALLRQEAPADTDQAPEAAVGAAEISALDRLASTAEALIDAYVAQVLPSAFDEALGELDRRFGADAVDRLLALFAVEFGLEVDAPSVGTGEAPVGLAPAARAALVRQLLLFWLLDSNPAAGGVVRALHAGSFASEPLLAPLVAALRGYFETRQGFAVEGPSLVELLLAPQQAGSLESQLERALELWDGLAEGIGEPLVAGLDLLREEHAPRFPPGPGPAEVPDFSGEEEEVRSFSLDTDWMPRMVLVAKHTYVWLDQLSRRYARPIRRLDEIPREALAELSGHGFRGLWLIGIWERSAASARIKQLSGNPEAIGSAYSLRRYRVAASLGGDEALERLAARAAECGMRLASDVVPNHLAIDSDWVLSHPEWFIGLDECPFPNYTFTGPDLSPDPRVGLFVEDHYFDRTDAAVVFKRLDRASGRARYIYHGNDGTSTPWNDTAQLDFLQPAVREAVASTIVRIARRFPMIRFDAAMTLTKRHFQRLWYPPPGGGGAIPTRSEHGLTPAAFNAAMPEEFWREVVDRVAREAPDTLLLAEAFWLMEGYFVRSLGMHRVYNSAFMNMLRDGETGKYRQLIRETLAFDPEILKRYVNFMSNPDERTTIDQFGDSDRSFGVCAVMATLPGLPMFGHGQVEGLREKYGMEYRRAYRNEEANRELVARHRRQIAPLLAQRRRFAEVRDFRLYDFRQSDGGGDAVNEDVLAFSNGRGAGTVVTLFNNRYAKARGHIHRAAPHGAEGGGEVDRGTLADALGLEPKSDGYLSFSDATHKMEYLAAAADVAATGLTLELGGFESRVLTGFEHHAANARLEKLARRLGASGVPDLNRSLRAIEVEPLAAALRAALAPEIVGRLLPDQEPSERVAPADDDLLEALEAALEKLLAAASEWKGRSLTPSAAARERLLGLITLPTLARRIASSRKPLSRRAGERLVAAIDIRSEIPAGLFAWLAVDELARALDDEPGHERPLTEWDLGGATAAALAAVGGDVAVGREAAERLATGLALSERLDWGRACRAAPQRATEILEALVAEPEARRALGLHEHAGAEWINREQLEALLDVLVAVEALAWAGNPEAEPVELLERLTAWGGVAADLEEEAESAGYELARLRAALDPSREEDAVVGESEEAAAALAAKPSESPPADSSGPAVGDAGSAAAVEPTAAKDSKTSAPGRAVTPTAEDDEAASGSDTDS